MSRPKHTVKSVALSVTKAFVTFIALLVALQWLYYTVTPRDWYYTYYEVIPTRAVAGETIIFTSDREIHRTYDMKFLDILRCQDEENGLRTVAERDGASFVPRVVDRPSQEKLQTAIDNNTGFEYELYVPSDGEECLLRTRVIMELPYGIKKTQDLQGQLFPIASKE